MDLKYKCYGCENFKIDAEKSVWGFKDEFTCEACEKKRRKKAIENYEENENGYEFGDDPICPYCGSKYIIDDQVSLYRPDNCETIQCCNCESEFYCNTYAEYSFTCKKIEVIK